MAPNNGRSFVWEWKELYKTLNAPHINERILLKYLYTSHLANVEWGEVEGPSKTLITRIGHKLRLLIFFQDGQITVAKALADLEAGVNRSRRTIRK